MKIFSNLSAPMMVWSSSKQVQVMYRGKMSSAMSKNVCSRLLYLYMWNESVTCVRKIRFPLVFMVFTGELRFFTYAFLRIFFLPIS